MRPQHMDDVMVVLRYFDTLSFAGRIICRPSRNLRAQVPAHALPAHAGQRPVSALTSAMLVGY
jgi:hypothetical protein